MAPHFRSETTSLTEMMSTPELSVLFQEFKHWHDALHGNELSIAASLFMEGDFFSGLRYIGEAFPRLFRIGFCKSEPCYTFIHDNPSFATLQFRNSEDETDARIVVIFDDRAKEQVAVIDFKTTAGRRQLIQFIHDWGLSHTTSSTSSVTDMVASTHTAILFKDFSTWQEAYDLNTYTGRAVSSFMQGDVFTGALYLGDAFPHLLRFRIHKRHSYGYLKNPRFAPLRFLRNEKQPTDGVITIIDKRSPKVTVKIDCRTTAGRRALIKFIYDWGKRHKTGSATGSHRREALKRHVASKEEVAPKLDRLSIAECNETVE